MLSVGEQPCEIRDAARLVAAVRPYAMIPVGLVDELEREREQAGEEPGVPGDAGSIVRGF
ncbi:hypothetical protein [Actinoplanes sp. NPDC051851]|uniref:hypothetical protein n=1 Tax=Actinoplanes sp. NPDC051851 TaxID=3154753 RepID=UPI00342AB63D